MNTQLQEREIAPLIKDDEITNWLKYNRKWIRQEISLKEQKMKNVEVQYASHEWNHNQFYTLKVNF